MLAGIILGVSFIILFSFLKEINNLQSVFSFFSGLFNRKSANDAENKLAACQLVKSNLNEMLDTLFSPANVKNSVSAKVRKSLKNGFFSGNEGVAIKNEILEAHSKYMAFGETLSRTTYSNKELINDYHNFIYRIIEKIDTSSLDSGT